ncbi:MAG: SMC-Scp complex subunit ScpB [Treponema sp.]|nr:SMC-Scp complex subunit ScpB [Treponema sp.]
MEEECLPDKEMALLETIFFLESEPRDVQALSRISKLDVAVVEDVIERLKQKYRSADSGVQLEQIAGGWILAPKKEVWELVHQRYGKKNEGKLSKAALETLSIIAYSQPVTKAEIESIRGVSADNMIHLLSERSLIKEVGKKDIPGKPSQYGTTVEFLKYFHLNSIAELPQLDASEEERFTLAR